MSIVIIGVDRLSVLLQTLIIIHTSSVVFLLDDHQQGDHCETAYREDITEPLCPNFWNVEESQEDYSDDVVPSFISLLALCEDKNTAHAVEVLRCKDIFSYPNLLALSTDVRRSIMVNHDTQLTIC